MMRRQGNCRMKSASQSGVVCDDDESRQLNQPVFTAALIQHNTNHSNTIVGKPTYLIR